MCEPTTIAIAATALSAGTTIYGAKRQQEALKDSGKFNAQINKINENLAHQSANDALVAGQQKESIRRLNTRQLVSDQRTGFAASGVVVGEGTTADVIDSAIALGELDALIIRDNALRESEAFELEAESRALGGGLATARTQSQSSAVGIQAASDLFGLTANVAGRFA